MLYLVFNILFLCVCVYPASGRAMSAAVVANADAVKAADVADTIDTDELANALAEKAEYSDLFDEFVALQGLIAEGNNNKAVMAAAKNLAARIAFIQKYTHDPILGKVLIWLQEHNYIKTPAVLKRQRLKEIIIGLAVAGGFIVAMGAGLLYRRWQKQLSKSQIRARHDEVVAAEKLAFIDAYQSYRLDRAQLVAAAYKKFNGCKDRLVQLATTKKVPSILYGKRSRLLFKLYDQLRTRRQRGQLLSVRRRAPNADEAEYARDVFDINVRRNSKEIQFAQEQGLTMPPLSIPKFNQLGAQAARACAHRDPVMEVVLASQLDVPALPSANAPSRGGSRPALPPDVVSLIHEYLVGPLPTVSRSQLESAPAQGDAMSVSAGAFAGVSASAGTGTGHETVQ